MTAKGAPITTSDTYCGEKKHTTKIRSQSNSEQLTAKEQEGEPYSTSQDAERSLVDIHDGVVFPFVTIHLLKNVNKKEAYGKTPTLDSGRQ